MVWELMGIVQGNQWNVDGSNGEHQTLTIRCLTIAEPLTLHASLGFSYKEFLACNPKEYDGKRCYSSYSLD
ncbi:hypothetical protein Tco_0300680 [Tanacetum coccineum]